MNISEQLKLTDNEYEIMCQQQPDNDQGLFQTMKAGSVLKFSNRQGTGNDFGDGKSGEKLC